MCHLGLDLDCGFYYKNFTGRAVVEGKARESDVDNAVKNNLMTLMRLGFFDGHKQYESLGKSDICTKENIALAAQIAKEGIVLLKNVNQTLPLSSSKYKNLAVIGPHANATEVMLGNYAGTKFKTIFMSKSSCLVIYIIFMNMVILGVYQLCTGVPCRFISPINGFSKYGKVKYAQGCGAVACKNESYIHQAMQASKNADATIIIAGLDLDFERESLDRTDFLLPGYQQTMIEEVSMVSKEPVILVIMSGGGLDISFAKDSDKIQSILWAGYPGEEGGQAIADIVFGTYNPGSYLIYFLIKH